MWIYITTTSKCIYSSFPFQISHISSHPSHGVHSHHHQWKLYHPEPKIIWEITTFYNFQEAYFWWFPCKWDFWKEGYERSQQWLFKSLLGQKLKLWEIWELTWVKDVYQQIKGKHKLSETCETKWKHNNKNTLQILMIAGYRSITEFN